MLCLHIPAANSLISEMYKANLGFDISSRSRSVGDTSDQDPVLRPPAHESVPGDRAQ